MIKNEEIHQITSCVPCEKFIRAIFIPDFIISINVRTSREAGPIVQIIPVKRSNAGIESISN
ncbi:hypothetical protein BLA29_014900 [Euroglyphus maynei]|uniref:Uncharacterized protein n=1 Tax=Euroglyphus maynei TaxID=6958 RepID=A0A1Y3BL29_EURMA|nr:hypothetical protein BLA29_014900 [Euroglyphus maynei]